MGAWKDEKTAHRECSLCSSKPCQYAWITQQILVQTRAHLRDCVYQFPSSFYLQTFSIPRHPNSLCLPGSASFPNSFRMVFPENSGSLPFPSAVRANLGLGLGLKGTVFA